MPGRRPLSSKQKLSHCTVPLTLQGEERMAVTAVTAAKQAAVTVALQAAVTAALQAAAVTAVPSVLQAAVTAVHYNALMSRQRHTHTAVSSTYIFQVMVYTFLVPPLY